MITAVGGRRLLWCPCKSGSYNPSPFRSLTGKAAKFVVAQQKKVTPGAERQRPRCFIICGKGKKQRDRSLRVNKKYIYILEFNLRGLHKIFSFWSLYRSNNFQPIKPFRTAVLLVIWKEVRFGDTHTQAHKIKVFESNSQ